MGQYAGPLELWALGLPAAKFGSLKMQTPGKDLFGKISTG